MVTNCHGLWWRLSLAPYYCLTLCPPVCPLSPYHQSNKLPWIVVASLLSALLLSHIVSPCMPPSPHIIRVTNCHGLGWRLSLAPYYCLTLCPPVCPLSPYHQGNKVPWIVVAAVLGALLLGLLSFMMWRYWDVMGQACSNLNCSKSFPTRHYKHR